MSKTDLTILMLHARDVHDPMLHHEFECFVERSQQRPEQFVARNLTVERISDELLEEVDAVMIGGSGAYSVVKKGFDWYEPLIQLMQCLVEMKKPTFASCFGFQALVQAMGGQVEGLTERAELGTFEITLTPTGERDPLFGKMPKQFHAQLGHNDSATILPEGVEVLASSERCPYQAIRVVDAPIYATQFHPELTEEDNITRYMSYIENYLKPGETIEHARKHAQEIHRPSVDANHLLAFFLEVTFGDR